MQFESISHHAAADITALFTHVFSDADGAKAGLQIGELTERMLNDCTSEELIGFVAKETIRFLPLYCLVNYGLATSQILPL
ncbi:hypothetical protein [Pseudoalteromonas sp. T1lg24]|uniref:hypothetical protein n=1 Tax=Pseudoalteromonas sp. T1lg24 TaxID=2077099 RepID=UPI000CF74B89|nr:hypothetical protein [Pseudoalteromonas sp. T1lg24]